MHNIDDINSRFASRQTPLGTRAGGTIKFILVLQVMDGRTAGRPRIISGVPVIGK